MRPALRRAIQFLHEQIGRARAGQISTRLPPLAALARQAGVSHVTMLAALHVLRDQHALTISHRHGTRVSDGAGVPEPPARTLPPPRLDAAWERVSGRLRDDCTRGLYPPGTDLPSNKTLAARYGVSRTTLSTALRALARDGDVEQRGRGYRRTIPRTNASASTIILFARGRDASEPLLQTQLTREEFLMLEQECRRFQVGLHPSLWYYATPERAQGARELEQLISSRGARSFLGCIVWDHFIPPELREDLLAVFRRNAMPYVAFASTGATLGSTPWEPGRTFHMGGRVGDGRVVGDYLLALGHRRVVYIHPVGEPEWSPVRAEGLRLAFSRYATDAQVIEVRPEQVRGRESLAHRLHNRLERIGQGLSDLAQEAPVWGELNPHLRLLDRLSSDIEYMRNAMDQRSHLFPLCERVLAMPGVSAWVGANDVVALGCLDYLRQNRVPVPGRISVVGFDDSEAAMARQMSSYNFNVAAHMQGMILRLLSEGRSMRTSARATEIDGYVQVRATSGPAPRQV